MLLSDDWPGECPTIALHRDLTLVLRLAGRALGGWTGCGAQPKLHLRSSPLAAFFARFEVLPCPTTQDVNS